jgi:7-carboxy-7-deazaguanine synthase
MTTDANLILIQQSSQSQSLVVAEKFGPTFQGEGASGGRQALFIRLSRCNLSCTWCDTPYTWDWTRYDPSAEATRVSVDELAQWVLSQPTRLVVITGGEPVIQQDRLIELTTKLAADGRDIEIETNGTIPPRPELIETVTAFNVSPKLASAGGARASRIDPAALRTLAASGKARFKFVITDVAEMDEVAGIVDEYGLREVWVMPEGTTTETVLAGMRAISEEALARGWNLTTRYHVLLWGDERGR